MHNVLFINWPEFLNTYWQKKPVILRQAFNHFQDPITPDELAGLAMEAEIDSRLVYYKNDRWHAEHGPFEQFDHLGEKNWGLLVQSVNHWHHNSASLVTPFTVLPTWRFDDLMVSYSVPGGGVGPHIDNYDVFIIQGMGKRHWRVGDRKEYHQFCSHPSLLHVEDFDPIIDEDLLPGDILYIPPGFPHDGFSIEASLSYSIGFRGPSQQELISSFADYVLDNDLGKTYYEDPELTLPEKNYEISPHELGKIKSMLHKLIDDEAHFENWFGPYITQSRHELDLAPAEPPYQTEEVVELIQKGEKLQRLNGLRLFQINGKGFIYGETIEIDNPDQVALLCRYTMLDGECLADNIYDIDFMIELTEQINKGYWYFLD